MAEPARPRSCCTCMCFRRAPNKAKPEEDEDASSIVFYRKFSDVWEEDSAEEEIITCSQPLDDQRHLHHHHHRLHHGDPCDYRKYMESLRAGAGNGHGLPPVRVAVDSASDVTSWVETPDSGEQTELIGKSRQVSQKMRDSRRLLTLPLKEDHQYNTSGDATSLESECDELNRHRAADLSFSIDDSISNFMQSGLTVWTAGSGLLTDEANILQEEVWSVHSDSAVLLRDYMFPNEDWQASLDSFGSDLDISQEDDCEDENGNADESTKILNKSNSSEKRTSGGCEENGNRKYFQKSPMSLPGDAYRPVRNSFDTETVRVHRNINNTRQCLRQEKRWMQGVKRKEAASSPDDVIDEAPLQSEIAA